MCTISYTAYTFAMGGLSSWGKKINHLCAPIHTNVGPSYLQRKYSVSTADAGLIFGVFAVVTGLVGTFMGGWMADYLAKEKGIENSDLLVSGVTLVAAAPTVALALNLNDLGITYLLLFVGMLLMFFNTGPMNALLVSCLPASIRATGVSLSPLTSSVTLSLRFCSFAGGHERTVHAFTWGCY